MGGDDKKRLPWDIPSETLRRLDEAMRPMHELGERIRVITQLPPSLQRLVSIGQGITRFAEPAHSTAQTPPKRGPGRPKGSGSYARHDFPLVQEMHELRLGGEAVSVRQAAIKVSAGKAAGASSESTAKRLERRYRKLFPNFDPKR